MIRYLDLKQFAEFESLIGIINLLWVIVWAISLFLVKEFSKDLENKKTKSLVKFSVKLGLFLGILFYVLFLIISPLISSFLHIENKIIIFITWITILFSFIWIYQDWFFKWKKHFNFIASLSIIWSVLKLWIWFLLVYLWFNIFWAIWWLIISQVLLLIIWYFYIKNKL